MNLFSIVFTGSLLLHIFTLFGCLRWMNSHTSLSHLDGFFLRLRLGRSEAGLGGTGYYVACINGKFYSG